MSDSKNPNRQPKGVPAGGQFAATLHSEPAIGVPGHSEGRPLDTREEWNAIPVGKHVLVQYTGEEGDGPGEVVFVRDAETLRWDYGPYRMSGGSNWDTVWDHQEGAVLLDRTAADARLKAHQAAGLARSEKALQEALDDSGRRIKASNLKIAQEAERDAEREKPLGSLRLALRRFWG